MYTSLETIMVLSTLSLFLREMALIIPSSLTLSRVPHVHIVVHITCLLCTLISICRSFELESITTTYWVLLLWMEGLGNPAVIHGH